MKQRPGENIAVALLREKLELHTSRILKHLNVLNQEGMVQLEGSSRFSLTVKGRENAESLVRAHRLWETYLVNKTGLDEGQIHADAERLEHLLPESMVDEVDAALGFPQNDPHGSPIPQKGIRPLNPLLRLKPRAKARIAKQQISDTVESELWELGLMANTSFQIQSIGNKTVDIRIGQKTVSIPAELAKKINVHAS